MKPIFLMIKKSLLPLLALTGLLAVNPALASDLPKLDGLYSVKGPKPKFSWYGPYVGAQLGAGLLVSQTKSGKTKKTVTAGGLNGGLYAGYNWQMAGVIFGLEADIKSNRFKKSATIGSLGTVTSKTNWSTGLKGRIGLPVDRFMPYVSLGLEVGDYHLIAKGQKKKSNMASLTLGGGVEYALNDRVNIRADYTAKGLHNKSYNFSGTTFKNTAGSHQLMVGISYKF
ncbi:MAG: outer membrane beta-barrel protein [Cohaesibacter sp.]|nr:outer membrane beta-barrel protein [Cohaesibacter sp.]MCV6601377.1 outer membrane beta-barrel protein [Cohaesibacter sp.]